jgi:hypothetical protein
MTTRGLTMLLGLTLLLAGEPSSLRAEAPPATRPTAVEKSIGQWIAELDHRSPLVRESAAVRLMGLSRDDLPALQRVIERDQPISPGQAAVLHDVVLHVWLTGEPYKKQATGFLGLSLMPNGMWDDQDLSRDGVQVVSRMPGFAAYGALLDGDLILQIREAPAVRFGMVEHFASRISAYDPGTLIHLIVQRGSRQVVVPVRLSARPEAAGELQGGRSAMDTLLGERILAAEKYYQEHFARLIDQAPSRVD